MRNGEYIDFYFFHDYPEHPDYMLCCQDLYYKDDLEHPELIDFLGTQFYVPRNPEKYLKFNYGENWRTPMQWNNYKMSPLKRKMNQSGPIFQGCHTVSTHCTATVSKRQEESRQTVRQSPADGQ